MPKMNAPLYSLNGGEIGDEALPRLDLERMQFAGALYSNMMPRVVGSMTLRPGLEYIADLDFGETRFLEFNYLSSETYLPIVSNGAIRFVKDNQFISRDAVSTDVTDGDFASFAGWTDASTGTATAAVNGTQLVLTGANFSRASATQTIAIAGADQTVIHGLRLDVERGPVVITLGTTSGGNDLIDAELEDGDHSLTFTPGSGVSNVYLNIYTDNNRVALLNSCEIDAAGALVLNAPYLTADLDSIRYKQSIDTMYIAGRGYQQRELVRRSEEGWGLQRYKVSDGPFTFYDGQITMTPSVFQGNGTLTASSSYFKPTMVGRLFRLTQNGQTVDTDFTAEDQQGDSVRISGVGNARTVNYTVAGTFVATWSLQVATDDGSGTPTGWTTIRTGTGAASTSYTDTDDNVIKFFRFAIEIGNYTSGTIETSLVYGGSQDGVCRMTGYTSTTVVDIEILDRFYSLAPTAAWDYSMWSDLDGWPTTVELFGGRVYWGRVDTVFGSVSDSYRSFDDFIEGDSQPIIRSLNSGGHEGAFWLLALQRFLAGTDASEVSVRSSAFDEPLTASNWFPLNASTQGSYNIRAVKSDVDGIYVPSDGESLNRLAWDSQAQDYASSDLTALHENIFDGATVVAIAIQRKPDTIIWLILSNGGARALTYQPNENVIAWSRVVTDGDFKDVAVIKAAPQDQVYFAVERNGARLLERMAKFSECKGGSINCLADAFTRFSGSPTTTFSVPHLDGRDVTVWADGVALYDQNQLYTVASSQVVIPAASDVVIGLPYDGLYNSTMLAYGAGLGTALFQPKRVNLLGLYFLTTMLDGIRVGRDANNLFKFTTTKDDKKIEAGTLYSTFEGDMMPFAGDWDTDSRIYLKAQSPYPMTIGALAMQVKTNDRG